MLVSLCHGRFSGVPALNLAALIDSVLLEDVEFTPACRALVKDARKKQHPKERQAFRHVVAKHRRATVTSQKPQAEAPPSPRQAVDKDASASTATIAHLQELNAQKDKTIQEYMQACTKYRADSDAFCAKAMEWKKKHDALQAQILQLEADNFVLRSNCRPLTAPPSPIENRCPSPVAPSETSAPFVDETSIPDEIAALKLLHAREVDALKLEASYLQRVIRNNEVDKLLLATVQADFDEYKASTTSEMSQLEAELTQFKEQLLVLTQDFADQIREGLIKQIARECAQAAREKSIQAQWTLDRVDLEDMREKMVHQQAQLYQALGSIAEAQTAYEALKDERDRLARRKREPTRTLRVVQAPTGERTRLRAHTYQIQRMVQTNRQLRVQLQQFKTRLLQLEQSSANATVQGDVEAQQPQIEPDDDTNPAEGSTDEIKPTIKRIEVLQDSLRRKKQREQGIQRLVRTLKQQMHSKEKEYAIFKASMAKQLQAYEDDTNVYKAAIHIWTAGTLQEDPSTVEESASTSDS
ncbi:unnamed protein product [Aphanomyces euteiches]